AFRRNARHISRDEGSIPIPLEGSRTGPLPPMRVRWHSPPHEPEALMTETVVLPTHPAPRRGNSFIVPLLVFPFLAYNLVVFLFFGGNPVNWGAGLFSLPMPSGMPWAITAGDFLLVIGIIMLFFEVL